MAIACDSVFAIPNTAFAILLLLLLRNPRILLVCHGLTNRILSIAQAATANCSITASNSCAPKGLRIKCAAPSALAFSATARRSGHNNYRNASNEGGRSSFDQKAPPIENGHDE